MFSHVNCILMLNWIVWNRTVYASLIYATVLFAIGIRLKANYGTRHMLKNIELKILTHSCLTNQIENQVGSKRICWTRNQNQKKFLVTKSSLCLFYATQIIYSKLQHTSWLFNPEKSSTKQEVNLHGRTRIQTFTAERSTCGTVLLTINLHHLS